MGQAQSGRRRLGFAVLATIATIAMIAGLSGCRTTGTIQNVAETPLDVPREASLEDVSEAIWRAGRKLGWEIEAVGPGELVGTLHVRRHVAVVTISHDLHRFSIRYRSSENLRQRGEQIHPKYNAWVQNLAAAIATEPIYTARAAP